MNKLLSLVALGACLAFGAAHAQDKPKNAGQAKMATCSKEAKGKKGDEYKNAVSECMKAEAKPPTQQEKMAACSKGAKGKKGDDYKNAVSECLKAKG
ncbi:MAG: PsiF family protein [Burkholderiaceae bacterium]